MADQRSFANGGGPADRDGRRYALMVTAKRARVMGLPVLVLMFAVGALTGAATMRVTGNEAEPRAREETRQRRPDLFERLDLTAEQRVQVDAIMERRREELDAF